MTTLRGSLREEQGQWLFKGISLELKPGGWTCLLGPSGVGKTTILRLLAQLPSHGHFDGDIDLPGEDSSGGHCSYMAQQTLLLPWLNVLDNIALGSRLRGEAPHFDLAEQLITKVGLSAHKTKKPSQLSGGMRQRVALARTLMEDRLLVLLDEPFSALDAKNRAEMQELSHRLLKGKTVLLVTHDPAEAARMGDRNYLLDEGGLEQVEGKAESEIGNPISPDIMTLQTNLLLKLRGEGR